MAGLSTYTRNKIHDAIFNATAFSVATPYISLHTADPGITGANEVAGGSYARQAGSFSAAASAAITSDTNTDFAGMPAVGGSGVTHIGVWDASSGGNFLWGGLLASGVVVDAGETFRLPAGDIDASLT